MSRKIHFTAVLNIQNQPLREVELTSFQQNARVLG